LSNSCGLVRPRARSDKTRSSAASPAGKGTRAMFAGASTLTAAEMRLLPLLDLSGPPINHTAIAQGLALMP